jgi:predicted MFS family arabinose efflux permease
LFGGLAERYGRRLIIMVALVGLIAAALVGAIFPVYGVFLMVMMAFGFAKMLVDPALLAYIGDRVPYNRRALAIGTTELSWAGALLVAAPLVGLLLERSTLSAVFIALAMGGGLGLLAVWYFLPSDRPSKIVKNISLREVFNTVRKSPPAMAMILFGMFNSASNELVFINYGAFMETSFGVALATLGFITISISIAEAIGEGVVTAFGDKFGPKRMTLWGMGIAAIAYLALPFLNFSLPAAVAGIFVMFLSYEIAVVASIPLNTEVLPNARAPMISASVAGVALGRLGGGVMGGLSYALTGGFVLSSLLACGCALAAFWVLWRYVKIA